MPQPQTINEFVCTGPTQNFTLGRILRTLPAKVEVGGVFVKMPQVPGPIPKFRSRQLKLIQRGGTLVDKSSVTRRKSKNTGNQAAYLDGLCVKMPIRKYQILNELGGVEETKLDKSPSSCVSFRIREPMLFVELEWDTGDDMDLELVEANTGNIIALYNTNNPATGAIFSGDSGFNTCNGKLSNSKEQVYYLPGSIPASGQYTIRVNYFENCDGNTELNFKVGVHCNGKVLLKKSFTLDIPASVDPNTLYGTLEEIDFDYTFKPPPAVAPTPSSSPNPSMEVMSRDMENM